MDEKFTNSLPVMCGYYSITSDRQFDETASSLRYFKEPINLPLDLNIGIDSIKAKPNSYFEEKMDSILTYILRNKTDLVCQSKGGCTLIPSMKYITYRGVIRKIMSSPYEQRNGWRILATKYKNNIYLSQLTPPEDRVLNEWHRKLTYYGPKFEQYCLTDNPSQMPDTSQQIDACTQFFGVFKRKLVGRNFLFAGEMDGVVSDIQVNLNEREQLNKLKFIELKVAANFSNSYYAEKNFKSYKCQNVWAQSFLTGVKHVYFGMRDNKGKVNKIAHYSIDDLPKICRKYWNPSKCFEYLDDFLGRVEERMKEIDCPHTVVEFHFDEKNDCTEHLGKTKLSLLPDWYIDGFKA